MMLMGVLCSRLILLLWRLVQWHWVRLLMRLGRTTGRATSIITGTVVMVTGITGITVTIVDTVVTVGRVAIAAIVAADNAVMAKKILA